jgi:DNA-binding PucR family transcriptional regulator
LLRCGPEPTPGIRARAEHAGVDLGVPRRVVALEPRGEGSLPYLMQLARADPATLMARRDDLLVLAVTDEGLEPTEAAVTALHRRAARAGIACRAGISDAHTDLAAALREAEAALGLAVADRDETAIVSAGSLGPMRFLLDARDTTQMTALVRRLLAPLADYDRVHQRATLLPTLRHYLEFDGRQLPAAEACHIHVSTLKYRMRRIAAVLPRPLHDPDMRFELRIAYAILDVLERLGEDPLGAA